MTILEAVRDQLAGRRASGHPRQRPGKTPAAAGDAAGVPYAGYERLDDTHIINGLSNHSQIELEAVENYERSHKGRDRVLDKLRYMRGREPLPGYDALDVEEILAALKEADVDTIKKVRAYERKFANRPDVLGEVTRVHHAHLEAQAAKAAP